jgi:DNA-binding transcriptional ArsR family regulator
MAFEALSGDPFEALGDEHRRAIVELLRTGDRSVQQLADDLPISRPAVSRHLRLLKRAGLVTDRAKGTRRLYRLHDEGIAAVHAYLQQVWGDAAARFRLAAENFAEPGSAKRVADLRSEISAEPGSAKRVADPPRDGGTQR